MIFEPKYFLEFWGKCPTSSTPMKWGGMAPCPFHNLWRYHCCRGVAGRIWNCRLRKLYNNCWQAGLVTGQWYFRIWDVLATWIKQRRSLKQCNKCAAWYDLLRYNYIEEHVNSKGVIFNPKHVCGWRTVWFSTRKLCYRKDDRAMRRTWHVGALKIFGTPWLRPRLLFPKFFMGFCADRPCEYNCPIWSP